MNYLDEIQNILSYDDKDEDEKIEEVKSFINKHSAEMEDLLTLKEHVRADIIADNFNINLEEVATEDYERILKLNKTITYE